jgi:hypothetical protein
LGIAGLDLNPNDRIVMGASNVPPGAIFSTDSNNAINAAQHTLIWTPKSTIVPPGLSSRTFSTRLQLKTADEPSTYMTVDITVLQLPSAPTNITFSRMFNQGISTFAPSITSPTIPSVQENANPGIVIGYLTTQDPDPEDTGLHKYALTDNANGRVSLKNNIIESGSIGANYEASDTFTFSVSSCDPTAACITRSFDVLVNDVNEPPSNIQLSANTVSEHAPANTLIGEISVDDPDLAPQVSGLGNSATSTCESNIFYNGPCITGSCPVAGSVSSFIACSNYCDAEVKCTALVYDGNLKTCTLKHARGTAIVVSEGLNYTSCTGGRVSNFGKNVLSIVSRTSSVAGNPAFSPFYLKGAELFTNGDLDYERNSTHHITVRACSLGIGRGAPTYIATPYSVGVSAAAATLGISGSVNTDCVFKDITINIIDKNDSPTKVEFLDKATENVVPPHPALDDITPLVTLAENSVAGTIVAKIRTIDPDTISQTFTYEIIGAASSGYPFKLAATSSTGIVNLVVNDSTVLDFESNGISASATYGHKPSRGMLFVRIKSTDSSLSAPVATLAVRLTNVVEAPTIVAQSLNMKLTELSAPGTVVGAVDASADAYGVHPLRYSVASIGGNASSFLGIHSCSGNVYVLDNFAPVFSVPRYHYSLEIEITGESTIQATVLVELTMRSRAPVWANGGADIKINLLESSAVDFTVVGSLLDTTGGSNSPDGVLDPNGDSPLFFSIVSGNKGGLFRISNSATGKIVVDRNTLDFESVRTYQLRIMVTDAPSNAGNSGMISYGTIVVNILDANDAPFLEDDLSFEVSENSVGGTLVGHPIFYKDEDIGAGSSQTVAFSISGYMTWTVGITSSTITEAQDVLVTQANGFETRTIDITSESISENVNAAVSQANGYMTWTITINSATIIEAQGVIVTQGGATGTLATALTGTGIVKVVITSAMGQTFNTASNLVIDSAGTPTTVLATDVTNAASVTTANAAGTLKIALSGSTTRVIIRSLIGSTPFDTVTDLVIGSTTVLASNLNSYFSTTTAHASGKLTASLAGTVTKVIITSQVGQTFDTLTPLVIGSTNIPANNINTATSVTTSIGNAGPAFAFKPSVTGQLIVAGTAGQINTNLNFESSTDVYTLGVVATDDGEPPMSGTATVTVAVVDVNEAPTFDYANSPVLSISEGAPNGFLVRNAVKKYTFTIVSQNIVQSVGVPVTQGLAKGTLSVALIGIGTTVVVTCSNDQVFDSSTNLVINSGNSGAVTVVHQNIVSVNFIPIKTENATSIIATDVDENSNLIYDIKSIKTGNVGSFAINQHTGGISVAIGGNGLDFETSSIYELLIRVTDNGGLSSEMYITVQIEDENETPSMPDSVTRYVNESASIGTYVGEAEISSFWEHDSKICGSDPDAGVSGELFFTIRSTDNPPFAVVPDGTLCLLLNVTAATIDYETKDMYDLDLRVTDKDASSPLYYDAKVSIKVVDVNEAPSLAPVTLTVRKHSSLSPAVGDHVGGRPLVAVDVDQSETSMTYTIVSGNTNNHWSISADTINPMIGHLTLVTANPSAGTETLQVSVTDSFGKMSASNTAITVTVIESNNPPDIMCYANLTQEASDNNETACSFQISEGSQPGAIAATLGGLDAEGDAMMFSIVAGNDLGAFEISQRTLALGVSEGADPQGGSTFAEIKLTSVSTSIIDYEATDTTRKASFRLVVLCMDNNANPLGSGIVVDISVSDENEAPVLEDVRAIGAVDYIIGESGLTATGTFPVGTTYGTDICDGSNECQFRTIEAAKKFCSVTASCTSIYQHPQAVNASNTKAYFCTSGKGCYFPRSGDLTTYDSDWAAKGGISYIKMDVGGTIEASVFESAIDGANVINLVSNDPDGSGDKNTFIIKSGNDLGLFKLDESTGSLLISKSDLIVYQGNNVPHRLTVEVEDSGGLAVQVDVMISILDANEAPTLPSIVLNDKDSTIRNAVRYISEDARIGEYVGTPLEVIDPDNENSHKWNIIDTTSTAGSAFSFMSGTNGQLILSGSGGSNLLDYEFETEQVLTILVEDDGIPAISVKGTVHIYILDENEAPIFDEGSNLDLYIQERDSTGTPVTANTKVGTPLRADDPDSSQTVRYSLTQINLAASNQCPCLDSNFPCHRGSETLADWRSSLDQVGWSSCPSGYGLSSIKRGESGNGIDSITDATCTAGIDTATCVEVDWNPGSGWHICPTNGNYVINAIYRSIMSQSTGGFADINKVSCCKLRTGLTFSSCQAVSASYLQSQGSVARCAKGSMIQGIEVSNTGLNAATSQPLSFLSGLKCCDLTGGLSDVIPLLTEQGSSCAAKTDAFGRIMAGASKNSGISCPMGTQDCFASTSAGDVLSQNVVDTTNAQWDLVFRQTQTDVCGIPTMETVQVVSSGSFETTSRLMYKGVDHSLHAANSFNMVVLDIKTERHYTNEWGGFIHSIKSYATGIGGSIAEVRRMMVDIVALRSGLIVLLACEGECTTFTSQVPGFESTLRKLGASGFNTHEIYQSFAMIGQKGAGRGRALQHSLRKGTKKTGFGKRQNGFCVKSGGQDENSGVVKLDGGNYKSDEKVQQCWDRCASYPGVTGCETIWDQGNRGCYVHTSTAIMRGNGVARHYCALYDGKTQADDSKVSFSCQVTNRVDAQDDTTEKMFSSGEWNRNSHNPAEANYAILDQIENFRNQDGSFLFKLVYPRAEKQYSRDDSTDVVTPVQILWSQTSNPVTSEPGIAATRYIDYSADLDLSACVKNGIYRSALSGSLLTGDSLFAIGATVAKDAYRILPGGRGLFAGACKFVYSTSQVELYVARPSYQQLVGVAANQVFRIDSISGQIFTTGLSGIDHESVPLYNLVVTAYDDGSKFHGGLINKTKTGETCNSWDESISTEYNTIKYKSLLSGHNFCRNPGGDQAFSWCFRSSDGNAEQCETGDSKLSSRISVRIFVLDANDPPIALFKNDVFYVNENTVGGVSIGTLTAADPDKNQILSFALNVGSEPVPFEIDSNTGEVRVINSLDFESKSEYHISATVKDSSTSNGKSDIGYFKIRLIDVNEPPKIKSNQQRVVAENSPRGTYVGSEIIAVDSDKSGSLSYIIRSGNELGLFTMRSCDGQISVQNSELLDYETLVVNTNIPLTVRVSDGEYYAETIVFIDVINVPESPHFNEKMYIFSVQENAAASTVVGTVLATHPDAGSVITYGLKDVVTGGLFSLHPITGVLTVVTSPTGTVLDYETSQSFILEATATDVAQMTATVKVVVNVGNVNEPPIVENNLKYYINEDRDKSELNWWSRFASKPLNGYDVDDGQRVSFSVVAGHGDDIFQTTAKGNRLYVKAGVLLDYEKARTHSIRIAVSDPIGLTTTVQATVFVLDINERPTLENARAVIDENSGRDTVVGLPMVVTDPDTAVFSAPYVGEWEKISSKGATYGTSDIGKNSFDNKFATSPTKILRRVCKNCGLQHKDIYYKRVTPFPSGTSIYDLLHVTWSNAGNTRGIDFNLYSTYKDAIGGTNAWSFCNYNDVGIGFPRDCAPSSAIGHQWQSYTRGGQRDWAWFVDISTTSASQTSLNENVCKTNPCSKTGLLKFTVISGNYRNAFYFPDNGADTYTRLYAGSSPICVGAGNAGTYSSTYSSMRKKCSAEPTCTGFTFTSNSSPTDSTVGSGTLKSCLISGKNVEFNGRESSGTFDYWKKSSAVVGQLTVFDSSALDHEKKNRFALRVEVRDSGLGGTGQNILSTTATFIVDVKNINEAPFFVGCENPIKLYVNEHRQGTSCNTNRKVGRVTANDVDRRWGDSLTMSIKPTGAPFTIDNNGVIRTGDSQCDMVDYEKTKTWNLLLSATDTAGLTASCGVTIHIRDLNEHPILTRKSTSVANSLAVGTNFGKPVVAVDTDSNQKHSYYVVGGNGRSYVGIRKDSGKLFVKNDMSSITSSKKQVLIRVHDNGRGKLMAQNWVDINIVNTNKPPTMDTSYLRSFPENSRTHALIGTPLTANDPDGDSSKIKFHKVSGDAHNCFSIDNYGGQLRLRNAGLKELCNDYESRLGKPWIVGITAIDSGAGALTASTIASIVVTDVNEAPQWSTYKNSKHLYIYESAEVGSSIASGAFAFDQDFGSSLSYSITRHKPRDGASTFGVKDSSETTNVISLQSYSAELSGVTEYISGMSSNRNTLSTANGLVDLQEYSNSHSMWNRASFREISGLSGEGTGTLVSYESVIYSGHYLSHDGSTLFLKKRTSDLNFDASATFVKHSALSTVGGDLSLECANKLGSYLTRDAYNGGVRVVSRMKELESSDFFSKAATWYRKPGLGLSGTLGNLVLKRPLDYDKGPRKFSLTIRATDTGETGCQNIVDNYRITGTLISNVVMKSNVWECCSSCGNHAQCRSYTFRKDTNECQLFKETFVRPVCYPTCTTNKLYGSGSPLSHSPYVRPLFTESIVFIHVLDVNEPPEGGSKEFTVPEDIKTGILVGTVQGRDPDKDQTIKYSIQRENCFEVTTGKTKAYKQLSPVYQGKRSSVVLMRVKSSGSVHLLLARASSAVEVTFAGPGGGTKNEIRFCKKYTPSPVPTVDQCETFASLSKDVVASNSYKELWVNIDADTSIVSAGNGPDPGAFESTLIRAAINSTIAPFRYSVSTGYNNAGHFAGICLPVESEQDDGVFTIDSTSGVIRIRKPILDYEIRNVYGIQVSMKDQGVTAIPSLTSFSFVRVNVIDVNEPPEFQGSAPGIVKTTTLIGCFYDKSTAITPRLDPDPLRDLPSMPSIGGASYRDVLVGKSQEHSKTIRTPGVLSCSNKPVNRQHRSWKDVFRADIDSLAGTVKVTRIDNPRWGWGQQLVLRCVVANKLSSGATKISCDKACTGFKYFGLQGNGECWCGNSYGKYGSVPGQCDTTGPFYGKNKNLIYRRGDESTSEVFSRTARVYTKGNNGENCGLRATPKVGVPLKTVGATGHLAIWDCSGNSDPIVITDKHFSTTIGNTQCYLRYSLLENLAGSGESSAAYWDCSGNSKGDEMSFSANEIISSSSNLALGRPTAQSSIRSSGYSSRAVDGNHNSRYHSQSCTHTRRDSNGPWWRVDLERVVDVSTIKITNRNDCCKTRIKNTKVYVGKTDILSDAAVCGDVVYTNTNPIVVKCTSSINGRYVWIKKTNREFLTLCEVEVYASKSSSISVAPLQSSPFVYVKGIQPSNSESTNYCGLSRHKDEGTPAAVVFGNQFPALFDCGGSTTPIQVGDEIAVTSELYYDDHNIDGSVKTEGWRDGSGPGSVIGNSNAMKTLTYGAISTALTSCIGQVASCREIHGPFASDTTKEISKEWKGIPSHTALRVKARIWSIGSWDNEKVIIETSNKALSEVKTSYIYLGCYRDTWRRDLTKYHGYGYYQNTCSAKCRGYKYFALQHNGQCFCGNSYGKYGRKPDRDCTTERGKSSRKNGCGLCRGGGWRNAVYRQTGSTKSMIQENWSEKRSWTKHSSGRQGLPWTKMTDPIYNPWQSGRGGAYYDDVNFVVEHTESDFTIVLRTSLNQRATDEYMAISNLQIYLEKTETSSLYCGSAVEHKFSTEIKCPNGESISSIVFASYGTPTGTASICSSGSYTTSSCHATESKSITEKNCIGRSKCTLSARNKIFGDPCWGIRKWLFVQYRCSPPQIIPPLQYIVEKTKPKNIVPRAKPASCPSDVTSEFIACMSIPEKSREGTQVGSIMASTSPGKLVYTLQANSNGIFSIDSNGGNIFFSSGAIPLDFETTARHELVVRASDSSSGLFKDGRILISITDVNEPPTFGVSSGWEIDENAPAGTFVGETVQVTDEDSGDHLSYALTGGSGIYNFNISQAAIIAVTNNGTLDHEVTPVFILQVRATDAGGLYARTTLVISINDVNESPSFPSISYNWTIGEHTQVGSKIGTPVKGTDPDNGQTLKYNILTVEPSTVSTSAFEIDSCSGQISLAEAILDFENQNLYTLTVQAIDDGATPLGLYTTTTV